MSYASVKFSSTKTKKNTFGNTSVFVLFSLVHTHTFLFENASIKMTLLFGTLSFHLFTQETVRGQKYAFSKEQLVFHQRK